MGIEALFDKLNQARSEYTTDSSSISDEIESIVAELKEQDRYKNCSDDVLEEIAYVKYNASRHFSIAMHFSACTDLIGRPSDPLWDKYTYDEIIGMAEDGVNVPDDILEWAYTMADSNTVLYEIDDSASTDSNTASNLEIGTDDSTKLGQQQKLQKFSSKADAQEDLLTEKNAELQEQGMDLESARTDLEVNQKLTLDKVEQISEEFKSLDAKIQKGDSVSEEDLFRYKELGTLLNTSGQELITQTKNVEEDLERLLEQMDVVEDIVNVNNSISSTIERLSFSFAETDGSKNYSYTGTAGAGMHTFGPIDAYAYAALSRSTSIYSGIVGINLNNDTRELQAKLNDNVSIADVTMDRVETLQSGDNILSDNQSRSSVQYSSTADKTGETERTGQTAAETGDEKADPEDINYVEEKGDSMERQAEEAAEADKSAAKAKKKTERTVKKNTVSSKRTKSKIKNLATENNSLNVQRTQLAQQAEGEILDAETGSSTEEMQDKIGNLGSTLQQSQQLGLAVIANGQTINVLQNSSVKANQAASDTVEEEYEELAEDREEAYEEVSADQNLSETITDMGRVFTVTKFYGLSLMFCPWTAAEGAVMYSIGKFGEIAAYGTNILINLAQGNLLGAALNIGGAALSCANAGLMYMAAIEGIKETALEGTNSTAEAQESEAAADETTAAAGEDIASNFDANTAGEGIDGAIGSIAQGTETVTESTEEGEGIDSASVTDETDETDEADTAVEDEEAEIREYIDNCALKSTEMQAETVILNNMKTEVENLERSRADDTKKAEKEFETNYEKYEQLSDEIESDEEVSDADLAEYDRLSTVLDSETGSLAVDTAEKTAVLDEFTTVHDTVTNLSEDNETYGTSAVEAGKAYALEHNAGTGTFSLFMNKEAEYDFLYGKSGESIGRDAIDSGEALIDESAAANKSAADSDGLSDFADEYSSELTGIENTNNAKVTNVTQELEQTIRTKSEESSGTGSVSSNSTASKEEKETATQDDVDEVEDKGKDADEQAKEAKKDDEEAVNDKKKCERDIKKNTRTMKTTQRKIQTLTKATELANAQILELNTQAEGEIQSLNALQSDSGNQVQGAPAFGASSQSASSDTSNSNSSAEIEGKIALLGSISQQTEKLGKTVTSNGRTINLLQAKSVKANKKVQTSSRKKYKIEVEEQKEKEQEMKANKKLTTIITDIGYVFTATKLAGLALMATPWGAAAGLIMFNIGKYGEIASYNTNALIAVAQGNLLGAAINIGAAALSFASAAPASAAATEGVKESAKAGMETVAAGEVVKNTGEEIVKNTGEEIVKNTGEVLTMEGFEGVSLQSLIPEVVLQVDEAALQSSMQSMAATISANFAAEAAKEAAKEQLKLMIKNTVIEIAKQALLTYGEKLQQEDSDEDTKHHKRYLTKFEKDRRKKIKEKVKEIRESMKA